MEPSRPPPAVAAWEGQRVRRAGSAGLRTSLRPRWSGWVPLLFLLQHSSASCAHSPIERAVADAMVDSDFVTKGWPSLQTLSTEPARRYGFLHAFISSELRLLLKQEHGLEGTRELEAFDSTASEAFDEVFRNARMAGVHPTETLLLLYCRTPVLTWHIVLTQQKLVVRSSAMAHAFGVRWSDILQFELSSTPPRHYTIRANPKTVHPTGQSVGSATERYDALGPFEERMLFPAVVVNLLEKTVVRITDWTKTEIASCRSDSSLRETPQPQQNEHCDDKINPGTQKEAIMTHTTCGEDETKRSLHISDSHRNEPNQKFGRSHVTLGTDQRKDEL